VLTPFVERLGDEEQKKYGIISPEVLNRTPTDLQRRYQVELEIPPGGPAGKALTQRPGTGIG
jgi:hypothetical protein